MTDIVVFPQTEQVKVRFEIRVKVMPAVHADLILIGIKHIGTCIVDRFDDLIESIRFQGVIVIAEHKILACCQRDRLICVDGDPAILFQLAVNNTFLSAVMLLNEFFCLVIRASVCQAELPVLIGLSADRLQQFLKIRKRCAVQRNHNADERLLCKSSMFLPAKCSLIHLMARKPCFISTFCHTLFAKKPA